VENFMSIGCTGAKISVPRKKQKEIVNLIPSHITVWQVKIISVVKL